MRWIAPLAALVASLAVACSSSTAPPPTNPLDDRGVATAGSEGAVDPFLAAYPQYTDEATGIRTVLGTPDLGVGRHRVAFALSDENGLVRLPIVRVASYFRPDGDEGVREGPVEEARAIFYEFPFGVRGIFSTELSFDRAGTWELDVLLPQPDGTAATVAFAFPVAEQTLAPAVGDPAPRTESRTQADVVTLAELTTGHEPDPALYQRSIAASLAADRPLVVVFASPAFCTNALCGPQVEVVVELALLYGDRVDFTHIDLYENPHEIKGDLDNAVRTPILEQWGIESDEWTFIVGADGLVAARFEAFVTRGELERALVAVLDGTSRD
ncbi:MAG TPA: hypothetical protein QGI71_08600 [Dehalococcoidia bacterium]|jgi:hypothetical protein|nr:hypothetical protein [Dehalococcoidia bacterium]